MRWTVILLLLAACTPTPTRTMGTPVSGEEFEQRIVGQVLSFRLPGPGSLDQAQFLPDGTAIYQGQFVNGIGRWRPWEHGYCAYYPWLGSGVGLRPPFSGRLEHDGYHCYELRAEDGYYVLFQRDGVYAGTLIPVPG